MGNGVSHTRRNSGAPMMNGYRSKSKLSDAANSAEAAKKNLEIEQQLAEERLANKKILKILLLGGAQSGKSTVFKQMRILHMNGFTESDYINYRYLIFSNTIQALQQLLAGCDELKISLDKKCQKEHGHFLKFVESGENGYYSLNEETGQAMDKLWRSRPIQESYKRQTEFELLDSAQYFLDSVDRISHPKYEVTHQDILRSRIATTGIHEISFDYRNAILKMVDVGGQKTEQRKWIHCFDNVQAVLFISALSGYDQPLDEEKTTNRLQDSLAVFGTIVQNKAFLQTAMILFLNKIDIFNDKIANSPLKVCFPDYKGANNFEEASHYIEEEFLKVMPSGKPLYSHFTLATDTKNVDKVFEACMDVVFKENMEKIGFL